MLQEVVGGSVKEIRRKEKAPSFAVMVVAAETFRAGVRSIDV